MRSSLPLLLSLLLVPGGAVADEGAALEAQLAAGLSEYSAHADFPLPELDEEQLRRLASGKIVRVREVPEDPDRPQRVLGLVYAEQDRVPLWIAALDPHFTVVDEVTEVRLTEEGVWPNRWYQHIDLPWPFTDRHWVVDVWNNGRLDRATGGRCWEHAWDLTANGPAVALEAVRAGRVPGVDAEAGEQAIYPGVNHGAWLTISVRPGATILGYHVTSVIGGRIPDKAVADYALLTLDGMLKRVVRRAEREIPDHYVGEHVPLRGGHERDLPPRAAAAGSISAP